MEQGHYRTVVVLGGCAAYTHSGYPEVNSEGQRLIAAAQLWHAGKTKTIVCTGEDNFIPDAQKLSQDVRIDRIPGESESTCYVRWGTG